MDAELNFSLSELEQAGFLSGLVDQVYGRDPAAQTEATGSDQSHSAHRSTTRGVAGPQQGILVDPLGHQYPLRQAITGTLLPANSQQTQSQAAEGSAQWVTETNNKKQAANRQNQKRWRAKQKVY